MVDFAKLLRTRTAKRECDPLRIFESLDRKGSHAALRPAQIRALELIHTRRAERDLILKMPTGLGKSAVGLLFLQSHMAESGRGTVFLCPTVQLVNQTLEEATRLGVAAHAYPGGQAHPHPDCLGGRAVTVCTYDKLFNGLSTFERGDVSFVPEAIVCDDAHAGVEEVLNAFTLRVDGGALFDSLRMLFVDACRSREPSKWDDILAGHPGVAAEVPHWLWRQLIDRATVAIQQHATENQVKFVWPRLRDHLNWTRVVVSSAAVEVSPLLPLVDTVPTFAHAKHRLFASATLADDSVLVRSLGCDADSAKLPVSVGSDSPPGERLVLVPSLIDPALGRDWVIEWAKDVCRQHAVVALCPSTKLAQDWVKAGADFGIGDTVEEVVAKLRSGASKFAVLAQRYDGVDLPDDACRVLVLDGLPHGESATDLRDRSRMRAVGGPRGRTMYRIEQGLGRAVRSPADFAVAILAGPELASFVSNADVAKAFGRDLQLQLDVARELAEIASAEGGDPKEAFESVVAPLLRRNPAWRNYYNERVRKELVAFDSTPDAAQIELASLEREAFTKACRGEIDAAARQFSSTVAKAESPEKRADLLEMKARCLWLQDPGEAMRVQAAAYAESRGVARPPDGIALRPAADRDAATRLIALRQRHESGNGLVAEFDVLSNSLTFDLPSSRFEEAIQRLGEFLGAESRRPEAELGEGPDNLLLWAGLAIVIECKNEARYQAIPKKDAEQLLHSVQWYRSRGTGTNGAIAPVFFGPSTRFDKGVHGPDGTRVVTAADLGRLVGALKQFVARFASRAAADWNNEEVYRLLADHHLNGKQFISSFTSAVVA